MTMSDERPERQLDLMGLDTMVFLTSADSVQYTCVHGIIWWEKQARRRERLRVQDGLNIGSVNYQEYTVKYRKYGVDNNTEIAYNGSDGTAAAEEFLKVRTRLQD